MYRRMSRKGRVQIVFGEVGYLDRFGLGVSMTTVARAMGLQPSTYIRNILWELWRAGDLCYKERKRKNGGIVRMWSTNTKVREEWVSNVPF